MMPPELIDAINAESKLTFNAYVTSVSKSDHHETWLSADEMCSTIAQILRHSELSENLHRACSMRPFSKA
jgi:hypothetical protein